MIIIAYIFIITLIFFTLFFIVGGLIEKNLKESNPIKKWWRKNIVDWYPYDDDNF